MAGALWRGANKPVGDPGALRPQRVICAGPRGAGMAESLPGQCLGRPQGRPHAGLASMARAAPQGRAPGAGP